jgi:hypothetical protein
MVSKWREPNFLKIMVSVEREPQINADEHRCEIMHLHSSTIFLNFRSGCDQEGGSG